MSFLQKNKPAFVVVLMVAFFAAIVSIFVSGLNGSKSDDPAPSGGLPPPGFATSTGNVPATARAVGTPLPDKPEGSLEPPPGVTERAAAATLPPPQSLGTLPAVPTVIDVPPGTNASPPPPNISGGGGSPLGTDFPPPLTFVPLPTETPPPGNGPPPGS